MGQNRILNKYQNTGEQDNRGAGHNNRLTWTHEGNQRHMDNVNKTRKQDKNMGKKDKEQTTIGKKKTGKTREECYSSSASNIVGGAKVL